MGIKDWFGGDKKKAAFREKIKEAVADGKLYYVSRESGAYVVEAGPKFKLLAHNNLKPDTSVFNACLAVSQSQLFLRSDRYLYCIGKAK